MARITPPARLTPSQRSALAIMRRMFGLVPEPYALLAHHRGVFRATTTHEGLLRSGHVLPATLRDLVVHRVSVLVGCSWCIDFGAMLALRSGLTAERIRAVADRGSWAVFDETERLALELADAATATPPAVPDELVSRLRAALGDAGLVELAHLVALENHRSRLNHVLGATSQGFTDAEVCAVREVEGPAAAG